MLQSYKGSVIFVGRLQDNIDSIKIKTVWECNTYPSEKISRSKFSKSTFTLSDVEFRLGTQGRGIPRRNPSDMEAIWAISRGVYPIESIESIESSSAVLLCGPRRGGRRKEGRGEVKGSFHFSSLPRPLAKKLRMSERPFTPETRTFHKFSGSPSPLPEWTRRGWAKRGWKLEMRRIVTTRRYVLSSSGTAR